MVFDYRKEYHRYKQYYLKVQGLPGQPVAQVSLTLVASLLTVAFFGIFAIKPTLVTIVQLTREIDDKTKVSKQLETKIAALNKIQSAYEEITSQLPLIDAALPKNPEFERLEQEIEFLAWQNQVILTSGSFSGFPIIGTELEKKDKKKEEADSAIPTETINISLTVAGSYHNLKSFIVNLEILDRVILVKSVHFSEKSNIKGVDLQATLTAQAFYKLPGVENVKK